MKAVVLAAGLGSRMKEITRERPKCLLPVGGKPLLERWLFALASAGVSEALVNTHYLADQVDAYLANHEQPLRVTTRFEEVLLGSGGTLAANRAFTRGESEFLVIYADNASTVDLAKFSSQHRAGTSATLGLFRVPDPENRGIVELDADGIVVDFVEKPENPRSDLAWAGLLVGTPALLDAIPDEPGCDLGHTVLPRLLGNMVGVAVDGYHRDVGTPENYRAVCADFEAMGSAA